MLQEAGQIPATPVLLTSADGHSDLRPACSHGPVVAAKHCQRLVEAEPPHH
jgi:hypothetical protein